MFSFTPSSDAGSADRNLARLIRSQIESSLFSDSMKMLKRTSAAFVASCSPPWPCFGLQLSPEIHYQSEQWLPLEDIRPIFFRFYRAFLTYPPILSSTPFFSNISWAGIAAAFPPSLAHIATPAALLEQLLKDDSLRTQFLLWSFMPDRFYGKAKERYPDQNAFVKDWLEKTKDRDKPLRCLDAACGNGSGTYRLVRLISELGWPLGFFQVEGWSLDPLEIWAAAHVDGLKRTGAPILQPGDERSVVFKQVDLLNFKPRENDFDLILCNGLLGGPIINREDKMERVVANLAGILRPGGMLLAANRFHGGWKQKYPLDVMRDLFLRQKLNCLDTGMRGEGIVGVRQI